MIPFGWWFLFNLVCERAFMKQVVIIGNGISGITAARHIRKLSKHAITVISSETTHFYSRTALMYIYMGQLTFEHTKPYEDWFWKKNNINLVFDHAERIDLQSKTVFLRSGQTIRYDDLIIATGSKSNLSGVEGENLNGVQTLYSYADLQKMQAQTTHCKKAVIIGGGLIGVEMAEMLHTHRIPVTMVVREAAFWNNVLPLQDAQLISNHIVSHGIEIIHSQQLQHIINDGQGNVSGIRTTDGEEIDCDFVGIAIGVHPNVSWLANSGLAMKTGLLVDEYLQTNVPGVYAIGDCVERSYSLEGRKSIEQVWYTARMMGEVVAQTVCGDRTPYRPGPWFNSAKFFDIEYQTYGNVGNKLEEDQQDFYWQHPSGLKAIHTLWNKHDNVFMGINSFGIRLQHDKFDRWLREKRSIHFVMEHLREANFDPEFTERHEEDIRAIFNKQLDGARVLQY